MEHPDFSGKPVPIYREGGQNRVFKLCLPLKNSSPFENKCPLNFTNVVISETSAPVYLGTLVLNTIGDLPHVVIRDTSAAVYTATLVQHTIGEL